MTGYLRTAHERAAYAKIVYAGTNIYINKLDIRDALLLEQAERALTAQRAKQGFPAAATHRTYSGLKAIHRHLFKDLYSWAGKERRYTTGRGAVPFARPEHIAQWMQGRFKALRQRRYLVGLDADGFANAAAEQVDEINAGHPFVDGNGRAQRFWLQLLADNAGYDLTLRETDRERWNEASKKGFELSDHRAMAELIKDRLMLMH